MKSTGWTLLIICLLLAPPHFAGAGNYGDELKKLGEENAKGYIGPFATAFGTGVNTGLYHTAKVHGWLGFDIGVKISAVKVPDEAKRYQFYVGDELRLNVDDLSLPNDLTEITLDPSNIYPDREVPTVFGESSSRTIAPTGAEEEVVRALRTAGLSEDQIQDLRDSGDLNTIVARISPLHSPVGFDLGTVPVVMPQVSLGLPMKTEVLARFLPETVISKEIGGLSMFGFGVKHSISQYIPLSGFLVDISGQAVYQKLSLGDFVESTHIAFDVHASRKIGVGFSLTPFIGIGYEMSNIKVDYRIEVDDPADPMFDRNGERVSFELDGDNAVRLTGGVRIGLPLVTINADYSWGEYDAASLGVGLTLR